MKNVGQKWLYVLFMIVICTFFVSTIKEWIVKDDYLVNCNYKGWLLGNAQDDFEDWYTESLPNKDKLVAIYNQFRYCIFDEASNGWIIGKDKYIFDETQTYNYVSSTATSTYEEYDEYAKKIYLLQEELKNQGKVFVYVVTPVKAQLCQEKLSSQYMNILEKTEQLNNYELLLKALDDNNVCYYDATTTLLRIKNENEYPTFGATTTHWTNYAAAQFVEDMFSYLENVYNEDFPSMEITPFETEPSGSDIELATLMNLKWYTLDSDYYDVSVKYSHKMRGSLFVFGTSFCGQLTNILERDSQAFDEIVYYIYLTRKMISNNTGFYDVNYEDGYLVNSSQLWDDLMASDYVLMESQGIQGILESHSKFLDYAIDRIQDGNRLNIADLECTGWSADEGNYRWSVDDSCSITINQPVKGRTTNVTLTMNSYYEVRNVDISVNGIYITTIEVRPDIIQNFEIEIDNCLVNEEGKICIEFSNYGDIYSPQEIDGSGLIGDRRTLGIGISDFVIRYAPK